MKLRYLVPLVTFVVPTVVIGYGVVIPNSPIAGFNPLTVSPSYINAIGLGTAGFRLDSLHTGYAPGRPA
jgi:hypothetical protein